MLLTDPPYNVNYGAVRDVSEAVKRHKRTDGPLIQNDNMGDEEFREFLTSAFRNANAVMRPGAVFYIWHADGEGYNFRGACRDVGWTVRQCLIWNKNTLCFGRQDYQWKHELGVVAVGGVNVVHHDVVHGSGNDLALCDLAVRQQEDGVVAHEILDVLEAVLVLDGDRAVPRYSATSRTLAKPTTPVTVRCIFLNLFSTLPFAMARAIWKVLGVPFRLPVFRYL